MKTQYHSTSKRSVSLVLAISLLFAASLACSLVTGEPASTPTPVSTSTPVPTSTPSFPSYSEIIKTYPPGIELSCTDVEVSEMTSDGKFVLTGGLLCPGKSRLTVAAGETLTIGEDETFFGEPWKYYGAKVTVLKTIVIDGKTYQAGSQLTVDKDLNWIQISSSTSTSEPLPSAEQGVPVIQSVQLRRDTSAGGLVIYQDVHFTDSDGDVSRWDFEIISTTQPDVSAEGGELDIPSATQKSGAVATGNWTCGSENYSVTLSVTFTDRAGHRSAPYEYTINCDAGN